MSFVVIKVSKSQKVKVALLRKVGESKLKPIPISSLILMVIGVKTIAQITLEVDVNLSRYQRWRHSAYLNETRIFISIKICGVHIFVKTRIICTAKYADRIFLSNGFCIIFGISLDIKGAIII